MTRALLNTRATLLGAAALCFLGAACGSNEDATSRTQVIFDTDWGPDVDDVGALAILHALADNSELDLLGIAISFAGDEVITGTERLREATTAKNPVHRAYEIFNDFAGRFSWDQTAVLAGVRGPEPLWSVADDGYFEFDPDGAYRWQSTPDEDHAFLLAKAPIATVEDLIERLMAKPPGAALSQDLQP